MDLCVVRSSSSESIYPSWVPIVAFVRIPGRGDSYRHPQLFPHNGFIRHVCRFGEESGGTCVVSRCFTHAFAGVPDGENLIPAGKGVENCHGVNAL